MLTGGGGRWSEGGHWPSLFLRVRSRERRSKMLVYVATLTVRAPFSVPESSLSIEFLYVPNSITQTIVHSQEFPLSKNEQHVNIILTLTKYPGYKFLLLCYMLAGPMCSWGAYCRNSRSSWL